MKEEIAATVFFITKLVRKHDQLKRETIEKFALHLTSILFERYKGHWYPENPVKGQAYRCIRVNKSCNVDPLLERTCEECNVKYEDLGLPKELTIWVDPFEVACRYGEKNQPFTIAKFEGGDDREISKMINNAVEKVTSDYQSGTSSDEESCSKEPKAIPTVSNPNSVYQFTEFFYQPVPMWPQYNRRKNFVTNDCNQQANISTPYKMVRTYRPSAAFSGPRVDRYHWVNAKR